MLSIDTPARGATAGWCSAYHTMSYRNYLPTVSILAAILILGWVLYDIAERFIPGWTPAGDTAPAQVKPDTRAAAEDYRLNQIIAAHLFGIAPKAQPVVQQAPETRLRLTLLGVMASNRDDKARAVIASEAASDRSYSIGDRINGTDAKLYAIETNRVIIERGKRLEKLSLERPDLSAVPSAAPASMAAPRTRSTRGRHPARMRRPPKRSAPRAQAPQAGATGRPLRDAQQAQSAQPAESGSEGAPGPEQPRIPF